MLVVVPEHICWFSCERDCLSPNRNQEVDGFLLVFPGFPQLLSLVNAFGKSLLRYAAITSLETCSQNGGNIL